MLNHVHQDRLSSISCQEWACRCKFLTGFVGPIDVNNNNNNNDDDDNDNNNDDNNNFFSNVILFSLFKNTYKTLKTFSIQY